MIMTIKNLWARKSTSLKVIISFTVMITVLCVFMTYLIAFNNESESIIFSYRSGHYYVTENDSMLSGANYDNLAKIDNVNDIVNYARLDPVHGIFDLKIIDFEGAEHECRHSGYYDGEAPTGATAKEIVMHKGNIDFIDGTHGYRSMITTNDRLEADYRWENVDLVLSGSDSVSGNEIILSKLFVDEMKLSSPLGQTISIVYNGIRYDNIKVVGILNNRYYDLTGNEMSPHMIMSAESDMFKDINMRSDIKFYTEVGITNYLTSKNVANDLVTKAGRTNIFSGSDYGLAMASTVSIVNIIMTGVMLTVGLCIATALLLNVLVNMGFIMVKKSNYYGILRAYGLKRYKLFNMMFLEIFILSMISAVVAYALTYGIVALLDIAMASLIGIGVTFTPLNVGVTFIAALLSASILSAFVTLINYLIVVRKKVITLLRYTPEN